MNRRDAIKAAIAAPVAVAAGTRAHASDEADILAAHPMYKVDTQPLMRHELRLPASYGPVTHSTQYNGKLVVFTESGHMLSIEHDGPLDLWSARELPFSGLRNDSPTGEQWPLRHELND